MKRDDKAPEYLTVEIKSGGELWGVVHALPKEYKTGTAGYFLVGKVSNLENPLARYQVNINVMLIGSKPKK